MKFRKILIVINIGLFLVWWLGKKQAELRVVFCDVGQGDGALIIEGERQILIDSGDENMAMLRCLGRYMPFWDKKIEAVMISHWDQDHSGGLKIIDRYYKIDKVLASEVSKNNIEQEYSSIRLNSLTKIRSGKMDFDIWVPEGEEIESNERSVIALLKYKDKRILFTGDTTKETEQRLVWRGELKEKVNILKVSHHGSDSGTSKELLETIRPEVAIISVGKNSFGHPNEEVLKRLEDRNINIMRTDKIGDIIIKLN